MSLDYVVAEYFAILPALFVGAYPDIAPLDVMSLRSPASAILAAVIFNALIIILLISRWPCRHLRRREMRPLVHPPARDLGGACLWQ